MNASFLWNVILIGKSGYKKQNIVYFCLGGCGLQTCFIIFIDDLHLKFKKKKWILNYLLVFGYRVTQTFNVVVPTVTTPLTEGGGHTALVGFNTMSPGKIVAGNDPRFENTELLSPVIVTVQVKVPVLVLPSG